MSEAKNSIVDCQPNCGACCIAITISSAIPGMPQGKLAGEHCVQLDAVRRCQLFGLPQRPQVCEQFQPRAELCAHGPLHAMQQLEALERLTAPAAKHFDSGVIHANAIVLLTTD
ncbi:YkgJ family cysteine cluster protein [Pseudomonadales bacterium]|nr:YkgJ family cysteine cluster protein [Pseudomonadales bacterium]